MNKRISFNDDWKYSSTFHDEMIKLYYDETKMEVVRIPHTNVITPFNYFDENIYQFVSCYRKHIYGDEEWRDKKVIITFEGVGHVAKVYLNGRQIAVHQGGYTAFKVDLAPYLILGEDNVLVVEVDSRESNNIPPFGNVIDYLTYGGIYREVYLDIKEKVYIEDVFVMTRDLAHDEDSTSKEVELLITLFHSSDQEQIHKSNKDMVIDKNILDSYKLSYSISDSSGLIIYQNKQSVLDKTTKIKFLVEGVLNWDLESPNLYNLKVELLKADNTPSIIDESHTRFGFRTCKFRQDGFYLNNKKIKIVGLNRHQSYPYVGYAMPKRMQQRDAQILKHELGVNAVRTSHYPQSKHFINHCDEIGLLVFTELPGWQHIGDEKWKSIACDHVREMVLQYRNHPSIIIWGVRINESQDDDEFYKETNQIAHDLDSTRQTGGVRYLKKSNLLEDVYTYNDFIHNGVLKGLDKKKDVTSNVSAPYLVTEFNGHMFPTKSFDNEEHRLNHALRHACVLDSLFEQENISGGFGWCMFDYNTHKDFGSGDKICYHGVMDMFRNPKLAAAVYASQSEDKSVCEVTSSLDIGDHPAGNIGEIIVFTNADSIKLYKNDRFIKEFYPSKVRYSNLPHPPVIIDDLIGNLLVEEEHYSHKVAEALKDVLYAIQRYGQNNLPFRFKLKMARLMIREKLKLEEGIRLYYKYIGSWGGTATTFRFEAIKDEAVVKIIKKKPATYPRFVVHPSDTRLMEEETYDVVDVRIKALDENDNLLSYYQEPITLSAWGAVELVGPKIISLKGGLAGTYVKTKGVKGEGGLVVSHETMGEIEIRFQVE